MLSKNKIKQIQSLNRKKNRDETNLFIAEGWKNINEFINSGYTFETIICLEKYATQIPNGLCEIIIADETEIKKASFLNTPQPIIALIRQRKIELPKMLSGLVLALDEIQDPGNLGTIIRTCSWFGIQHLICSPNTVDCYNPKVVQASMGALAHVNVIYTDLFSFLSKIRETNFPVYGTFLDGKSIYTEKIATDALILFGNEGNGISSDLEQFVSNKLYIPPYTNSSGRVESLNVSIAAAIICSEFRRPSH